MEGTAKAGRRERTRQKRRRCLRHRRVGGQAGGLRKRDNLHLSYSHRQSAVEVAGVPISPGLKSRGMEHELEFEFEPRHQDLPGSGWTLEPTRMKPSANHLIWWSSLSYALVDAKQ